MVKDQVEGTDAQSVASPPHPFEAMFDQVTIGMGCVALTGQLLHVNQYLCDITGYTQEELLQRTLLNVASPEGKSGSQAFFRECTNESMQGRSIEKRYVRKDGSLVWVNVTLSLVKKATGEPDYMILVMQDISERKRAEEEHTYLEGRTQEFLNVLLAMTKALVAVPASEREESAYVAEGKGYVSTATREISHRLLDLIGSALSCDSAIITTIEPVTDLMQLVAAFGNCPAYQACLMSRLQGVKIDEYFSAAQTERLKAGEMLLLASFVPVRESQSDYEACKIIVAPIRISDTLVGILGLEKDREYPEGEIALIRATARLAALVLEREQFLQERAAAQTNAIALREANRSMDEFLSIASHELKNPLAAIKGNVQLAGRRLQSALRRWPAEAAGEAEKTDLFDLFRGTLEALGIADRQVSRLNRLVGDLLDISRIQTGKMEMHFELSDLRVIVHEAVESQRMAMPECLIHLVEPAIEMVPILADADRIEQVVINYLTNAARYSPQGRPIEVSLSVHDGEARIAVRDEGPGLSRDQQQLIWERFHQVKEIRQRLGTTSGLGLGLYISRMIIEQHHGYYGVTSAAGAGSIFWFSLPLEH